MRKFCRWWSSWRQTTSAQTCGSWCPSCTLSSHLMEDMITLEVGMEGCVSVCMHVTGVCVCVCVCVCMCALGIIVCAWMYVRYMSQVTWIFPPKSAVCHHRIPWMFAKFYAECPYPLCRLAAGTYQLWNTFFGIWLFRIAVETIFTLLVKEA